MLPTESTNTSFETRFCQSIRSWQNTSKIEPCKTFPALHQLRNKNHHLIGTPTTIYQHLPKNWKIYERFLSNKISRSKDAYLNHLRAKPKPVLDGCSKQTIQNCLLETEWVQSPKYATALFRDKSTSNKWHLDILVWKSHRLRRALYRLILYRLNVN